MLFSSSEKYLFGIYSGSSLFVIGLELKAVVIIGSDHSSVIFCSSNVNSVLIDPFASSQYFACHLFCLVVAVFRVFIPVCCLFSLFYFCNKNL